MESTLMYRELHMYMFSERQSPEAIVAALKGNFHLEGAALQDLKLVPVKIHPLLHVLLIHLFEIK